MKLFRFVLFVFIIFFCSCDISIISTVDENSIVGYFEDTETHKVFGFGNTETKNNVLVVIGMDVYKERIEPIGTGNMSSKILNYLINPTLYYYHPTDPNSSVFNEEYVSNWFDWKDSFLTYEDAYYYVIITKDENKIMQAIKSSDLLFNYFVLYFHGDRSYINSRAITSADLVYNFDDKEIQNSFSPNCFSLVISCNSNGLGLSNYSFAVVLSYLIGTKNMYASSSVVFDDKEITRNFYGDFKKVSYLDYDLDNVYKQYKDLSSEQEVDSYREKHLNLEISNFSILDKDAFDYSVNKELYYFVYSCYDDYYKNINITNSYSDIYLNYETKEVIWKCSKKNGDYLFSNLYYKINPEYFNLISFVSDVYNPNNMDGKYIEFIFK